MPRNWKQLARQQREAQKIESKEDSKLKSIALDRSEDVKILIALLKNKSVLNDVATVAIRYIVASWEMENDVREKFSEHAVEITTALLIKAAKAEKIKLEEYQAGELAEKMLGYFFSSDNYLSCDILVRSIVLSEIRSKAVSHLKCTRRQNSLFEQKDIFMEYLTGAKLKKEKDIKAYEVATKCREDYFNEYAPTTGSSTNFEDVAKIHREAHSQRQTFGVLLLIVFCILIFTEYSHWALLALDGLGILINASNTQRQSPHQFFKSFKQSNYTASALESAHKNRVLDIVLAGMDSINDLLTKDEKETLVTTNFNEEQKHRSNTPSPQTLTRDIVRPSTPLTPPTPETPKRYIVTPSKEKIKTKGENNNLSSQETKSSEKIEIVKWKYNNNEVTYLPDQFCLSRSIASKDRIVELWTLYPSLLGYNKTYYVYVVFSELEKACKKNDILNELYPVVNDGHIVLNKGNQGYVRVEETEDEKAQFKVKSQGKCSSDYRLFFTEVANTKRESGKTVYLLGAPVLETHQTMKNKR